MATVDEGRRLAEGLEQLALVDSRFAWLEHEGLFFVHAPLHASGFGNQVGMLLQHVALAAFSARALVLPPIHQPREHRSVSSSTAPELRSDAVFNLSAMSPLARVISHS